MKIKREWLYVFPVINFERLNHLVDVEMVLEFAEFSKDFTDTSKESAEFLFESLVSELWHLSSASDHFLKMVEILIRFNELIERKHCLHVDIVHLWVSTFYMFNVEFVPLFAELQEILFPAGVGLESAIHLDSICSEHVVDLDNCLLAVPHINHSTI